jgi:hypothetical protein
LTLAICALERESRRSRREGEGWRDPEQRRFKDCMGVDLMDEKMCLVNSDTTNSIFREIKYFQTLTKNKENV